MTFQILQSYSHEDWKPAGELWSRSRTEDFVTLIRNTLKTENNRTGIAWMRDQEGVIRFGDNIETSVADAISECDLGLVILSRSYVASESCRSEFDQLVNLGKPIFIVQLEQIDNALVEHDWGDRTKVISQNLRCRLFEADQNAPGREKLYGWPTPMLDQQNQSKFCNNALHLAQDIRNTLENLRLNPAEAGDSGKKVKAEPEVVDVLILAPCPEPEADTAATELVELLAQKGIDVVRLKEQEVSTEVLEDVVPRARVVAQVFGIMPGRPLENEKMLVEAQFTCSEKLGKRPQVWVTPSARKHDHLYPSYAEFVRSTEHDTRPLAAFARSLLSLARAARNRDQITEQLNVPAESALVLVDAHHLDYPVGGTCQEIIDQQFQAFIAQEKGAGIADFVVRILDKDKESFRNTKELLKDGRVHGLVMVYGPSEDGRKRLNDRLPDYARPIAVQRRRAKSALGIGDPCDPSAPPAPVGMAGGKPIHKLRLGKGPQLIDTAAVQKFLHHVASAARETPGSGTQTD